MYPRPSTEPKIPLKAEPSPGIDALSLAPDRPLFGKDCHQLVAFIRKDVYTQARHLQVRHPGMNSRGYRDIFPGYMSTYKPVKRGQLNKCLATLDELMMLAADTVRVNHSPQANCLRRGRNELACVRDNRLASF